MKRKRHPHDWKNVKFPVHNHQHSIDTCKVPIMLGGSEEPTHLTFNYCTVCGMTYDEILTIANRKLSASNSEFVQKMNNIRLILEES